MASRTASSVASCSKFFLDDSRSRVSRAGVNVLKRAGESSGGRRLASSSASRNAAGKAGIVSSARSPSIPPLPNTPGPHNLSAPQAAFLPPQVIPRSHSVHVASLQLRSHDTSRLIEYTDFALHAAHSLGIPCSRPTPLPVERSLYTVPKSPFVHKKSQENFQRKTHKRLIKAYDAHPDVLDKWFRYLGKYSLGGVGLKAEVFEWAEIGCGQKEVDETMEGLRKSGLEERVRVIADGVQRDLREDAEIDRKTAREGEKGKA